MTVNERTMVVPMVGLMPELNTIFIHLRLVLKFENMQKTQWYRWNQILNLGKLKCMRENVSNVTVTFIPFRMIPFIVVQSVCIIPTQLHLSWTTSILLFATSTFGTVHNYRILVRMLRAEGRLCFYDTCALFFFRTYWQASST